MQHKMFKFSSPTDLIVMVYLQQGMWPAVGTTGLCVLIPQLYLEGKL